MEQWAELHKMPGAAMKEVIRRLWLVESVPISYFGLVWRLIDALPRIEAIRLSVCIEDAGMAFAHVKMRWAKMKAAVIELRVLPEARTTAC